MYPGTYAETQPDHPAIIHPASGTVVSYRELNQRSNQLAQLFYGRGLNAGDHVALFLENHPAYLEIVWACLRCGLVLTPINRHLSANEAAYIVADCDASALIASSALEQSQQLGELAQHCTLKLSVGGELEGFGDYADATAAMPLHNLPDERLGGLMLYSSGTTGRPKGIKRPPPNVTPAQGSPGMLFPARMFGMDNTTIYLAPAPLYHAAPLGYSNATIMSGGTVVLMDKFEPEEALQLIERYCVTHSQWVPTMFIKLLKLPEAVRRRYDLSSQRCAIHAAAPCPADVKHQMIDWWGPVIEEYYSSTEGAGFARINSQDWLARPGSVGRSVALPFHICDEQGAELPPGQAGLIYAEMAEGALVSYHKAPQKTASAHHPQHSNWLSVGDMGYLDDDGYLFLTDRKSFMIISGGVNIYPRQIEDALALHEKLEDVAVIGVPHEELGEAVLALVQLAQGTAPGAALVAELESFVRSKLGTQLVPRAFEFVTELPRMPTGKLNKQKLRDHYASLASTQP